MTKQVLLLKLSYWVAALADFAIAILVWVPERMGVTGTVYPMGLASVMALSWGVLLLVADRKPVERKWVLIPTILVVTLIVLVKIGFYVNSAIGLDLWLLVFAVGLIMLMAYSVYYVDK